MAPRRGWRLHACAGLHAAAGMLFAAPALAQEPPPPDQVPPAPAQSAGATSAQVYEPAFFARFAPTTAAGMVNNIPGFEIASGGGEQRGFGQARQNVLINGRRVSGKSNNAATALGRIAAENVIRIEIVDGATLNIPGLSGQVANVIAEVDAFGGNWEVEPEIRENLQPSWFNIEASANGRAGGWSWSVGIENGEFHNGHDGPTWIRNGQGVLTDLRTEGFNGAGEQPELNATLTYETRAGSIANLNLSLETFNFIGREDSFRRPFGQQPVNRFVFIGEDDKGGEIGADWEFDLGPGRLKLIGLQRVWQEWDLVTVESWFPAGGAPTGDRSDFYGETGESILRSEYNFGLFGGDAQWAAEGAFNFLDVVTDVGTRQANGSYAMRPLPSGTARVEEKRAETNVSWSRQLSPAWSLQSSLGVEYSELSQQGAGGLTREFVRPKGFLALVWRASDNLDFSFKGERRVGQLNFGDFISNVDLQQNASRAGNVDLVPEQSWVFLTEANQKLGAWGAIKVSLEARHIEDAIDQVPIDRLENGVLVLGSGVGNIEEAFFWGVSSSGTINFDPIGLKGLQLSYNWRYFDSELDDPLTGIPREISGMQLLGGDMRLRWDVPDTQLAFTVGFDEFRSAARYRLDQISRNWNAPSTNFVSVEHKDVYGMKVELQVSNLNDTSENFKREVYQGGRRTNPLNFSEERHRTFGPIVRLEVSGTF